MGDTTTTLPRLSALARVAAHTRWTAVVVASPDPAWRAARRDLEVGATVVGRHPNGDSSAWAIADPGLSRTHAAFYHRGTPDAIELADLDSHNGTFWGGEAVTRARIGHGAVVRVGGTLLVVEAVPPDVPDVAPWPEVPGDSTAARRLRGQCVAAASGTSPVLVTGATGTGKEWVATALHRLSGRQGPLVRVNVAAVPAELFEAELFGVARGAYTGAVAARPGRFAEAHTGTLVLDEIGDLPLLLQVKLLRALEEGRIRAIGASSDTAVDVRVIASTNADLERAVAAGRFRQDLAARMRMLAVAVPTLTERAADLVAWADRLRPRPGTWADALDADAVEILLLHDWRDGLRELKAALLHVEGAAGTRDVAGLADLPARIVAAVRGRIAPPVSPPESPRGRAAAIARPDGSALAALVARHRGNIEAIAAELGVDRKQVYRWFDQCGISRQAVERARR